MKLDVKICGITSLEDARAACSAGADFLGFVFYERSPRAVTAEHVRTLLEALDAPVRSVGVFVNASCEEVCETVHFCGLDVVQLHGDESPEAFASMPCPVWRAVAFRGKEGWCPPPSLWSVQRYVVDAPSSDAYGGTGRAADWEQACRLADAYPVMLAGGLRADNVALAIQKVRPMGVDVSSGVESKPGVKSHDAIRAFVQSVRQAEMQ